MSWWEPSKGLIKQMIKRDVMHRPKKARPFYSQNRLSAPLDNQSLWTYRDSSRHVEIPLMALESISRPFEKSASTPYGTIAPSILGKVSQFKDYFSDTLALRDELTHGARQDGEYEKPRMQSSLSSYLTPVQLQLGRPACTAFASAALLELTLKKQQGHEADLSEQHLFFRFYELDFRNHQIETGFPLDVAGILLEQITLRPESYWPYQGYASDLEPPLLTGSEDGYRIGGICLLGRDEIWSPKNFRLLESLIDMGYAVAIEVTFGAIHQDGKYMPVKPKIGPDGSNQVIRGSHSVLLHGYNSTSRVFFAKDSTSSDPETHYSYELIALNARNAFVCEWVKKV